jgi:nitrous oxidase accessory protein
MQDAARWGTSTTQSLNDRRGEWLRPVLTVLITILVALSIPLAATPVAANTAATQDDAEPTPNNVLLVDDDGTQCPNASYDAIQPALNDSAPDDTVLVCQGTYTDNVTVDTPGVTLKAANESVVLDGEERLGTGVHVRASGVTVDGLTVRDFESAAIVVASDEPLADVRVTDNDVTTDSFYLPAIYVDGARGAQVSGNTVTDSGSGIWLIGSRDTTIRDNELTDYSYIGILESSDVNSLRAERNRLERRLGEFEPVRFRPE